MTTETQASAGPSVSERLVTALADTWRAIQARHPDLPEVVFVFGSGATGRRKTIKHGHFASRRWARREAGGGEEKRVHEVLVGGEGLVRGPLGVLETALHEAGHVLAEVRGIDDTSMGGRYHNRKFAAVARELGLDVADNGGSNGWSGTSVPEATARLYAPQLEVLAGALSVYRLPDPGNEPGSAATGRMRAAVCGCARPRRFRIARGVLELGAITCGVCGEPFTLEGVVPGDLAGPGNADAPGSVHR